MTPETAPYNILFMDQAQNEANTIPTPNDINGFEILIHESTGSRLVRMQQKFVMKFGIQFNPIEAHNMLYMAKSTTVPVPRVYAIYQSHPENERVVTYIVMEYVPGMSLLELWAKLDQAHEVSIAKNLRAYFDELRHLEHPNCFGNITGGPPLDDIFSATEGAQEAKTSFRTEDELIDCIIRIYSLKTGDRMTHKTRYYQHVLPTILRGNGAPLFTHNDFQRKNIMVRPNGMPIIIDWGFASWYPTYWDYSTATYSNGGWNDDWHEYVRMVLDEYPNQSLWLSGMKLEIWY